MVDFSLSALICDADEPKACLPRLHLSNAYPPTLAPPPLVGVIKKKKEVWVSRADIWGCHSGVVEYWCQFSCKNERSKVITGLFAEGKPEGRPLTTLPDPRDYSPSCDLLWSLDRLLKRGQTGANSWRVNYNTQSATWPLFRCITSF